ncbi:carbohydrate-binding module family 13 protein [Macrolepiota fuliginosa MF-IS2]|uniref:Carbohydrate-binding module family 13 protein n=1 Tax=Macrolepiota fuliginosa MF-IS2 TaxID=1400762 RepID=A0A9P5X7X8_9AGAR|nr:carbohydrate-binding module family 13 protein [Macrolepiota fuliginosa MF-IS2]
MGFCDNADCAYNNCSNAYTSPPTRFPNPGTVAPQPPLYGCPHTPSGFTVTFCPTGEIPNYQSRPDFINPNGNSNKCLDVKGGVFVNGTPVQIYDCNGSQAQMWSIIRGNGTVRLSGTNYCLDAGSSPGNGVKVKIWTCYEGLVAQQWSWTDDNHIALTGRGLCLDLTSGKLDNGNPVQTWQCMDANQNQIWT